MNRILADSKVGREINLTNPRARSLGLYHEQSMSSYSTYICACQGDLVHALVHRANDSRNSSKWLSLTMLSASNQSR